MKYLKNVGISLGYIIGISLILTLLMTVLNYFDIIKNNFLIIFKLIIPISSLFIGGFIIGKGSKKKGWLEGLKLSLIFITILLIINFIVLNSKIEFKNLLYYLIISVSCIFGSIIGINKNQKNS